MTEAAQKTTERSGVVRPLLQRRKMALLEQTEFLSDILQRCQMLYGDQKGQWAGEATLALGREDMEALQCIKDTLNFFDFYKANEYVKREIVRRNGARK